MLAHFSTFFASASDLVKQGADQACGTGKTSACNTASLGATFHTIANTLTFVIGGIAVIMVIIGGLRYVLANGDSKAAADARNTILYSVIGIVVALSAWGIVNFVVTKF